MPSKSALNLTNLEALGSTRLAELLLDVATGDANTKRRLRMELAGDESPSKLSVAIRKRLSAIGGTERYIGWRALKPFMADLDAQREFIVRLAEFDTPDALELAWQFLGLCTTVLERTTDPSGDVLAIFQRMASDIGGMATAATTLPKTFIADLHEAIRVNVYGQSDGLILSVADTIGHNGLTHLDASLHASPPLASSKGHPGRRVSRWVRGRTLETETIARRRPKDILWLADVEIADGLGDVDRYIGLQSDPAAPAVAAAIAERLIGVGRAEEALKRIDQLANRDRTFPENSPYLRLCALEALGRDEEAQAFRWQVFTQILDSAILRDYLKRLPDFDDVEAEERAMNWALCFPDALSALRFLTAWPAPAAAASLVIARADEIDGGNIAELQSAADKLAPRYPLAGVLVLRLVVEHILANQLTGDYEAAGHLLADLGRLSARVPDWQGKADDARFNQGLWARYGSVSAFWRAAV